MHIAVLDLGTNTFQLLIAKILKGNISYKTRHERWVYLAEGGIEQICNAALHRAQNVLQEYNTIINKHACRIIVAIGTAAFRRANNAEELRRIVSDIIGVDVNVLQGEEEAYKIYKGVCAAIGDSVHTNLNTEPFMLMDIGGGSTEFVIGTCNEIICKQSFPIGATVMKQKHQRGEVFMSEEILEIKKEVLEHAHHILHMCKEKGIKHLIGVAGSFDTYAHILEPELYARGQSLITLNKKRLIALIHQFYKTNEEERRAMMGEKSFRAPMITVAGAISEAIIECSEVTSIYQSAYSLKEGVLQTLVSSSKPY